jgi:hypothetical protein
MRGSIEIDSKSGNVIDSTLQTENTQKIADCIISMLQDVATYMRQQPAAKTLENVTLKLDSHHVV